MSRIDEADRSSFKLQAVPKDESMRVISERKTQTTRNRSPGLKPGDGFHNRVATLESRENLLFPLPHQ